MTTNYEKIKNITVEEMAEFVKKDRCNFCDDYNTSLNKCTYHRYCSNKTSDDVLQWLQSESEEKNVKSVCDYSLN